MAGELQIQHTVADLTTVYAVLRNSVGQVYNGSSFETYSTGNLANYDIAMSEQGTSSRYYAGTMPSVAAGVYYAVYLVGSVTETDTVIGVDTIHWDGSAVVAAGTLTTAAGNQVADQVLRRRMSNAEASSFGDSIHVSSLYGLVQQNQESNLVDSPGDQTIYQTDGTTVLGTRAVTSDLAAEPVTGVS